MSKMQRPMRHSNGLVQLIQSKPEHVSAQALEEVIRIARESFTPNQLFYLADGFAEAAREKRGEAS